MDHPGFFTIRRQGVNSILLTRWQHHSSLDNELITTVFVWLGGVVVSALGMRTRRPLFESRVTPLFHWEATFVKLFTHIASPVSQLQETGVEKGVFGA